MENAEMKIKSNERFIGIVPFAINSEIATNAINKRIHFLIENYLEKIFDAGEKILYRDIEDHRLWELIYPDGYMNGWGVPALRNITSKDASEKYKVYLISPNETIMENDDCRIYALTNGYLKMIFDAGWGNALYQDPSDERLWELKCCFKNAKKEVILKHISKKQAKIKYAIEKIRPSEIIIDSDWTVVESQEVAYEIAKRIYWLTHNYLELIFDAGWEMLYIDPHDKRLWELTYPKSEMHGGGPPMLRYITEENAKIKYTIEIIKPIVGTSL